MQLQIGLALLLKMQKVHPEQAVLQPVMDSPGGC